MKKKGGGGDNYIHIIFTSAVPPKLTWNYYYESNLGSNLDFITSLFCVILLFNNREPFEYI